MTVGKYIKRFFGLSTKESEANRKDFFESISTKIFTDGKFDVRVEQYKKFHADIEECKKLDFKAKPEKIIDKMLNQTYEINNKLQSAAIPYGRSGDKDKWIYTHMTILWDMAFGDMSARCEVFRSLLKRCDERGGNKPEVQKMNLARELKFLFNNEYLVCALIVAGISWFGIDVTGTYIGAVQTVTPFRSGEGLNIIEKPNTEY